MKLRIAVTIDITQREEASLAAVSPLVMVQGLPRSSQENQSNLLASADVVFGQVTRKIATQAQKARWFHHTGAGTDDVLSILRDRKVLLTSSKGLVGTHLADHAWALILALCRQVVVADRNREYYWNTSYWERRNYLRSRMWELHGRTVTVVGFGGTGKEVARRARGFGMRVLAIDPRVRLAGNLADELRRPAELLRTLGETDVVVIAAPLTPHTNGLFDARAFEALKPGAILINVARGKIVVHEALLDALGNGRLFGVGLDVTEEEPLSLDDALWQYDNVIITPHIAGGSPNRHGRTLTRFRTNLRRFLRGAPLLGVVDFECGY